MAKRDIDFLFEMGSLRNIPRAWQQVFSVRVQNIAEHSFRVPLIAWIIALSEKADVNKVLKMALIHDIGESRAIDIAFLHREYVTRHGDLAEKHIFQNTTLEKEAEKLFKEYNERKTLEAKIVKDADNIDIDLELKELAKTGDTAAVTMRKETRPIIRATKLYTKTARKMWDSIQKADPGDWHRHLTNKWANNRDSAK